MIKTLNKIIKPLGIRIIKAMAATGGKWTGMFTGSFGNAAKEKVNNQTALTVSSLYACIRNVSEDIAKLPLKIFKRDGDFRYEQPGHQLYNLLRYRPNPEMTAMDFRATLNAHAMGWGNGYAEIQRDINGRPVALWPLRPDRVTMFRQTGTKRIFYRVTSATGQVSDIWAEDIFHLHGLGYDGVTGYNIVKLAANAIGAAIGTDKFAGSFFGNGLNVGGHLKHPENLSKDAADRLKQQMQDEYGGSSESHKTLVLEEGMEFIKITVDPKAAQMIETRRFSVTEFCRWLRVPPHKVSDLSKATFSNIEEQNIDYVQDGLMGWIERWEQVLWWKLLSEAEQESGFYFKHIVSGLLRGDSKARFEGYAQLWDRAVLSTNDIRALEDMNPIPGGDVHFVPLNFVPLDQAGQADAGQAVITDLANRIATRELREIYRHAKHAARDMPRFQAWLEGFYQKHDAYIARAIEPLALGDVNIDELSLKQQITGAGDPVAVVDENMLKHAKNVADKLRGYYEN